MRLLKIAIIFALSALFLAAAYATSGGADTMQSSYYGSELSGSPVACTGEPFNPSGLTAAHKTLPCGTKLLVHNGDKAVSVTVTDRGPFAAGRDIDLSEAAAFAIGLDNPGPVEVEQVGSEKSPSPAAPAQLPKTGGIGQ